jgi:hypothetical protein
MAIILINGKNYMNFICMMLSRGKKDSTELAKGNRSVSLTWEKIGRPPNSETALAGNQSHINKVFFLVKKIENKVLF